MNRQNDGKRIGQSGGRTRGPFRRYNVLQLCICQAQKGFNALETAIVKEMSWPLDQSTNRYITLILVYYKAQTHEDWARNGRSKIMFFSLHNRSILKTSVNKYSIILESCVQRTSEPNDVLKTKQSVAFSSRREWDGKDVGHHLIAQLRIHQGGVYLKVLSYYPLREWTPSM